MWIPAADLVTHQKALMSMWRAGIQFKLQVQCSDSSILFIRTAQPHRQQNSSDALQFVLMFEAFIAIFAPDAHFCISVVS